MALIRWASSPAALRVKVTPSTWSGRTKPLATSHTTRSDMVAVLPEPAPATTRRGVSGAVMTSACSGVGGNAPRRAAMSSGACTAADTSTAAASTSGAAGTGTSELSDATR